MAIVKKSIKEQVYEEIRNRIITREYTPGSVLNISRLSEELGVSNSPIREALAMLAKEDLLTIIANSKYKVVELDENLLQQVDAALVSVLIGAARLCFKMDKVDELAVNLEKAYAKQCDNHEQISLKDRYWLAMDFDKEIVKLTENDLIMKDFENLASLLYFSTSLTDAAYENSVVEHKAILEAVKEKDYLKVVEALEDHLIKHFLPEERD